MSGETWTEYAVRTDAAISRASDLNGARVLAAALSSVQRPATIVGRTVTASPWLPVDTEPQP